MLTTRQAAALQFIESYQRDHGAASPSLSEIAAAVGIRAKSGSHRLLEGLIERGFIRKRPHQSRSIEILRRASEVI